MTTLQRVDLQIFSAADCGKLHNNKIHATNICGGVIGGGMGQCSGDSGGPLIVDGLQVGIVSWSMKPCTVPPFPGKRDWSLFLEFVCLIHDFFRRFHWSSSLHQLDPRQHRNHISIECFSEISATIYLRRT